MFAAIKGVISDIAAYLRDHDFMEDYDRAYAEERRRLREARRIKKRLPKLIRELETTLAKLRELAQ